MGTQAQGLKQDFFAIDPPADEEKTALEEYRAAFIKRVDKLRKEQLVPEMNIWELDARYGKRQNLMLPASEHTSTKLCSNLHLCDFYPKNPPPPMIQK